MVKARSMDKALLVFAFGMSRDLLREMRDFRDSNTISQLHSYPLFGCQVDWRSEARCIRGRRLFFLVFLLLGWTFGAVTVEAEDSIPARAPLGQVWEAALSPGVLYYKEVEALIGAYEVSVGLRLQPGERGKVGLKVNARGGRGLSTPPQLLRAVIEAMEARGFERDDILIVDYSAHALRQAGILPSLSEDRTLFDGCPVLALDSEQYYDADWFYDSPLPPTLQQEPELFAEVLGRRRSLDAGVKERKSFLPAPLLFDVDLWINLAVGVDDPALGIDGVLANATLWNVSNSQRFLVNQATASAAVAEIAAIPELQERMVLHFLSLERYQFIGGPFFNSIYSRSESRLWMSSDPVALDRLLYDRMNALRLLEGFPEINPLPRLLPFAASLGLGVFERSAIRIDEVEIPITATAEQPNVLSEQFAPGVSVTGAE
jgi:hypothetical protein